MYTYYVIGEFDPTAKMAYIYQVRGKRVSSWLIEDYETLLINSFPCSSYEELCNSREY